MVFSVLKGGAGRRWLVSDADLGKRQAKFVWDFLGSGVHVGRTGGPVTSGGEGRGTTNFVGQRGRTKTSLGSKIKRKKEHSNGGKQKGRNRSRFIMFSWVFLSRDPVKRRQEGAGGERDRRCHHQIKNAKIVAALVKRGGNRRAVSPIEVSNCATLSTHVLERRQRYSLCRPK